MLSLIFRESFWPNFKNTVKSIGLNILKINIKEKQEINHEHTVLKSLNNYTK